MVVTSRPRSTRETTDDVALTWVPLYHDMGLVTGVLLHTGYHSVLLSPDASVGAPASWLDAVPNCGGTLASAPNVAYDLCVRKADAAAVAVRSQPLAGCPQRR